MGDDGEAAQPEQVRAAVGVGVEAVAQAPRAGRISRPPSLPRRRGEISSRSSSSSSPIVPSSSFSATLPVKPSATTTSAAPRSRSRASVLPAKSSSASREQRVRLERDRVALLRLLADREQAHLGIGHVEDLLGEDGAHVRELEEVLGPRVGVGARRRSAPRPEPRGNDDGDRRTHHAGQAPDVQQPGGEHRARVPCGDDRVGFAGADGSDSGDEARVRLRAHRVRRLLVHLDHVARLDELEALRVEVCGP